MRTVVRLRYYYVAFQDKSPLTLLLALFNMHCSTCQDCTADCGGGLESTSCAVQHVNIVLQIVVEAFNLKVDSAQHGEGWSGSVTDVLGVIKRKYRSADANCAKLQAGQQKV